LWWSLHITSRVVLAKCLAADFVVVIAEGGVALLLHLLALWHVCGGFGKTYHTSKAPRMKPLLLNSLQARPLNPAAANSAQTVVQLVVVVVAVREVVEHVEFRGLERPAAHLTRETGLVVAPAETSVRRRDGFANYLLAAAAAAASAGEGALVAAVGGRVPARWIYGSGVSARWICGSGVPARWVGGD